MTDKPKKDWNVVISEMAEADREKEKAERKIISPIQRLRILLNALDDGHTVELPDWSPLALSEEDDLGTPVNINGEDKLLLDEISFNGLMKKLKETDEEFFVGLAAGNVLRNLHQKPRGNHDGPEDN